MGFLFLPYRIDLRIFRLLSSSTLGLRELGLLCMYSTTTELLAPGFISAYVPNDYLKFSMNSSSSDTSEIWPKSSLKPRGYLKIVAALGTPWTSDNCYYRNNGSLIYFIVLLIYLLISSNCSSVCAPLFTNFFWLCCSFIIFYIYFTYSMSYNFV